VSGGAAGQSGKGRGGPENPAKAMLYSEENGKPGKSALHTATGRNEPDNAAHQAHIAFRIMVKRRLSVHDNESIVEISAG
jgi:hypothetical protein